MEAQYFVSKNRQQGKVNELSFLRSPESKVL